MEDHESRPRRILDHKGQRVPLRGFAGFRDRWIARLNATLPWSVPLAKHCKIWHAIFGTVAVVCAFVWTRDGQEPQAADSGAFTFKWTELQSIGFAVSLQGRLVTLKNRTLSPTERSAAIELIAELETISQIHIESCGFTDLRLVEKIGSLKRIVANENKELNALWDSSTQPLLQIVVLIGNPSLKNISGLSGHPQLLEIDLSRSGVESLTGLTSVSALSKLTLNRCQAFGRVKTELNQDFPSVESISLLGCDAMSDLNWLTRFPNLKHLDLTACSRVVDIDSLVALTKLKTLGLSETSVPASDIVKLKAAKSLERVFWAEAASVKNLTEAFTFSVMDAPYSSR